MMVCPPNTYVFVLFPLGIDFTTVTAAVLKTRAPDGSTADWAVTMSNQTPTTLTLTHTFSSGDLVMPGAYDLYALLTVPGGHVRSETRVLPVLGTFDVVSP
jgi:hypothetical protein